MCKVPAIPSICRKWLGGKHYSRKNITWRKAKPLRQRLGGAVVGHAIVAFPFERRDLRPNDILMEVLYTGICHTDLHQANHNLPGKRRTARARPADGRPRVSTDNQALRSDKERGFTARSGAHPTVTSDSKAALARPLNRQPDSAPEITRRQAPVFLLRVIRGKSPLVSPLSGFWLRP